MKRVLSTHEVLSDKSGEPIHVLVRESDQLQSVLAFFEQDIEMENTQPSYERLKKHG